MAGEIRLRVVPGAGRYSPRDPLILTPYLVVVYLYTSQHKTQQLQRLAPSDSTSSNLTSNSRQRYITSPSPTTVPYHASPVVGSRTASQGRKAAGTGFPFAIPPAARPVAYHACCTLPCRRRHNSLRQGGSAVERGSRFEYGTASTPSTPQISHIPLNCICNQSPRYLHMSRGSCAVWRA